MNLRKWRIARAVEQGNDEQVERLAQTKALRRYAGALMEVDRRLRAQAAGIPLRAPADLAPRIVESVRELGRDAGRARAGWLGWRPNHSALGIVFGASLGTAALAGVVMVVVFGGGFNVGGSAGPMLDDGVAEGPVAAGKSPVLLDPAAAIIPVGRVVQRVESPLLQEAELLRRDTQRAAELVISALPFGGGFR